MLRLLLRLLQVIVYLQATMNQSSAVNARHEPSGAMLSLKWLS